VVQGLGGQPRLHRSRLRRLTARRTAPPPPTPSQAIRSAATRGSSKRAWVLLTESPAGGPSSSLAPNATSSRSTLSSASSQHSLQTYAGHRHPPVHRPSETSDTASRRPLQPNRYGGHATFTSMSREAMAASGTRFTGRRLPEARPCEHQQLRPNRVFPASPAGHAGLSSGGSSTRGRPSRCWPAARAGCCATVAQCLLSGSCC